MAAFIDAQGHTQQVEVSLATIRAAKDNNESVRDHINRVYPTNTALYGDAFHQMAASEGLVLNPSRQSGLKSASLDSVINGRPKMEAGVITKQESNQARVLLMPTIGALVEDKLLADLNMDSTVFDSMIALETTITDDWFIWPEANFSRPEAARSQTVSQMAKPAAMLTLTTSEKSLRVPTVSLSIEWSDQAARYLNLDFISLSIARQVAVERNERANANLLALYSGDADVGQASLTSLSKVKNADTFDSTITTDGALTQKALIMWLYTNSRKRRITHVVTDIAGALAIENRTGKPTIVTDNPNSPRINAEGFVINTTFGNFQIFITDDANWPANTVMGVDARYGIHRVTSTSASYEAQEQFVLTRSSAMRFDYGNITRRLYDDAFDCLALINT